MDEGLPLLASHLRIGVAENETNSGKEIALPRSIAADDNVEFGREGVDDGLIFVAGDRQDLSSGSLVIGGLGSPHLLKPWIVICLMCIVRALNIRSSITGRTLRSKQI